MATLLHRKKGEQFFDSSGNPLAGGKLYFYEATTTDEQTTYSDAAGSTANTNPVVLDSAGRLEVPIYFGDSDSFSNYKELLTTAADVTVSPWPFDNIPAATPEESAATFAPPLFPWNQVTNADSPVALTAADAGKAYEADTTSGNIEFDLPSAASVGDGKGFWFKKTASANSMILDPSGSETIDNSSTSLSVTAVDTVVGIVSNGAEWYQIVDARTLKSDAPATLTAGFDVTEFDAGTKSSGTFTPDPDDGNFQKAVNGGAHTLAPPATSCTMVVQYTNNASAGAITTSGFTKVQGAFTTTNGHDFMCYITRVNSFSHLSIVALQ